MTKFLNKIKKLKHQHSKKTPIDVLIDQIDSGKVLPLIGNRLSNKLIFGEHDELIKAWASYIDYPFSNQNDLTKMMQFHNVMSKADPDIKADFNYVRRSYLDFLKEILYSISDESLVEELKNDFNYPTLSFSDVAARMGARHLSGGENNALLLLADLPLPIYLTTSYHNFITDALIKAKKKPRVGICRWHPGLETITTRFNSDLDYRPSPQEPLVFHLYGIDTFSQSIILTEDDHLDFLITIAQDKNAKIPGAIRRAIIGSSLMLLGYSVQDWEFKTIFRGLIKSDNIKIRPKSVYVQLIDDSFEKEYLQHYLSQEASMEVVWKNSSNFMHSIWRGWKSLHG